MNPFKASVLLLLSLSCFGAALADEAGPTGTISGEVGGSAKRRVNLVIHLDKVPGTFRAPVKPAEINQKGMKFVPHVLAILKGTTVKFLNEDNVRHNVFSPDGEKYNLGTWPQGESRTYTFKNAGIYHQLCNVHPEMGAVIVVLDNPFFAVTGEDGKFKLENVPPGSYSIIAWSEKGPEVKQQVTVTAGGTANVKFEGR